MRYILAIGYYVANTMGLLKIIRFNFGPIFFAKFVEFLKNNTDKVSFF